MHNLTQIINAYKNKLHKNKLHKNRVLQESRLNVERTNACWMNVLNEWILQKIYWINAYCWSCGTLIVLSFYVHPEYSFLGEFLQQVLSAWKSMNVWGYTSSPSLYIEVPPGITNGPFSAACSACSAACDATSISKHKLVSQHKYHNTIQGNYHTRYLSAYHDHKVVYFDTLFEYISTQFPPPPSIQ